jgi:dihydroxyacetone kinase-like protein
MVQQIVEDLPFVSGDKLALMINGLGGTPQCELYLAYRKARELVEKAGMTVEISMVGEFFTGLEMGGFSVTLSQLDDETTQLLKAPANTCMYKVI